MTLANEYKEEKRKDDQPTPKVLNGFVGIANLPNQVHRTVLREGFQFTILVVGESGVGKSTLLNALFLTDLYIRGEYPSPGSEGRIVETTKILSTTVSLQEKGVRLDLTLVDTPGFGDAVDNTLSIAPVVEYVKKNFEIYLDMESRVRRCAFPDTRAHACLYIIPPTCHGLRAIDVKFMKALSDYVNIIPIIGKSDSLNKFEMFNFKRKVRADILKHQLTIFTFNRPREDLVKEDFIIPFAVTASTKMIDVNGEKVLGRAYPWGSMGINDANYSDFVLLRQFLLRTHLQSLRDHTHEVLYEKFRTNYFSSLRKAGVTGNNLMEVFREEMKLHDRELAQLREKLRSLFEEKVAEKEAQLELESLKLKEEVCRHEKLINECKLKVEQLQKTLEQEKSQLMSTGKMKKKEKQ
jgi:septin 7